MGRFRELFRKSQKVLRDDGVQIFVRRVRNYVAFHKGLELNKRQEMKDILFVNGCTLPHPERYRVDHQIEQLEACGLTADKILYTNLKPSIVKFYRTVVFFRCPITDEVRELIKKSHYYNKKVFFDIDDLVIDKKYTDEIPYVKKMSPTERAEYDDGVKRMGETMKLCDYCITTTPALARELRKYKKEVYINRNVASEEMVKLSLAATKKVQKKSGEIVIGYLSGSITHNPDLELIKPALIKILDEFPQTRLCIMGHLNLPKDLARFSERITRKPFSDWLELPEVIASLDINLAPIEESIFNEAKSENKWTEAALCNVVTVASDFGAFRDVIKDGKDGLLCKTGEDWYKNIKNLILNQDFRQEVAKNAHKKAMREYITTYTGQGLSEFIQSKLSRNLAFVLPSTNISGGVNVVLKHCNILRRAGWDVTIINMDTSDENIENDDGKINVVSGVKHNIVAGFDTMVATLYTTLKFVRGYPSVKSKRYLVQNFETDFSEYGLPARREANATYLVDGIEYLTISKWCKEWLEKDFHQKVKFAPNGLDLSKFKFQERKFGKKKIKILIEGNSDDYYKNVDESFRVAAKLEPNRFEIVYLSYQGKPKDWYKVDEFHHKVSHDEVGKIYAGCDILLKTSILESFSYPPLEMMATGGFVVAVPNDGNREYLENEENCLFYEQGNIDDAISQIERLVNDVKLRKKLAVNGRRTAEARDWKKIESQVLKLYEK